MFRGNFILFFVFLCLLSSCGGGGDAKHSITLLSCSVNPIIVSRGELPPITFSWEADYSDSYYVDIFVSKDDVIDQSDIKLVHLNSSKSKDSYTLDNSSDEYIKLTQLYGGPYYLIFDVYTHEIHSIKYIKNFILKPSWTVMIYMDGDNTLWTEIERDLDEEIVAVGSSKDVNVVVQTDTISDTTKRYVVYPGEKKMIEDLGELNMAEPSTLVDFGNWVTQNYPADHYLLIIWNHGTGFKRKLPLTKNILFDETSGNVSMSIPDLGKSLLAIKNIIGKKIDIIGFDACLMNMIEIGYEIKDSANILIGSENLEPLLGWPYDEILKYLSNNSKKISVSDLSVYIVNKFIAGYTSYDEATLASIDLSKIDEVISDLNALTQVLINGIDEDSSIANSIEDLKYNLLQHFDDGDILGIDPLDDSYVDLYHLTLLIEESLPQYSKPAKDLLDSLTSSIIVSENTGTTVKNAYGLSIWFPDPGIYPYVEWLSYEDQYMEMKFFSETLWMNLIKKIWGY